MRPTTLACVTDDSIIHEILHLDYDLRNIYSAILNTLVWIIKLCIRPFTRWQLTLLTSSLFLTLTSATFWKEILRFQPFSWRECEMSTNPDPYNTFLGVREKSKIHRRLTVKKYDWIVLWVWQPKMVPLTNQHTTYNSRNFKQITSLSWL